MSKGLLALALSRWPAHNRPPMSTDVPPWWGRSLLSWLLGNDWFYLAMKASISAVSAGRHEIVDTTVTADATE
jgi:hypothetical protein